MSETPIKTTARFHEALQVDKQKPIIRIDSGNGQAVMSHVSNSTELANTIRASIDSGRDNPFRPDGEIYKMTDPIVDYYLFGPDHSRSKTPIYAELDSSETNSKRSNREAKKGKLGKKSKWRREAPKVRKQNNSMQETSGENEQEKQSCWRRWFFCCCCCCRRRSRVYREQSARPFVNGEHNQMSANIDYYNRNQTAAGPVDDLSTKTGHQPPTPVDMLDAPGRDSKIPANNSKKTINNKQQPTSINKVVVLDDKDIVARNDSDLSQTSCNTAGDTSASAKADTTITQLETETKTRPKSRCIIS